MNYEDRFDSLIQYHCERLSIPFSWLIVKAQIRQESCFKAQAKSGAGAQGLMQLMPATDIEIDGDLDGFEIEGNLDNGIRYLLDQYNHFPEIPAQDERVKLALASYNGGRGYINAALKLAYEREHGDVNQEPSKRKPGLWQTWEYTKEILKDENCFVLIKGRHSWPDFKQIIGYVASIRRFYEEYRGVYVINELSGGCK